MTKERRTVSIEKEVDEYLASEGVNASELVNKLVKNHASAGGDKRAMLELREEQLLSDINSLEQRLGSKREELERVQTQLDKHQSERENIINQASEALGVDDLDQKNRKVEYWAGEVDLPVDEFVDLMRGRV